MTKFDPCRGIVRILHFSGKVEGVGFLIGHRMVITCAHVYDKVARDQRVCLDFPLLENNRQVKAILKKRYEVNEKSKPGELEDLAILSIPDDEPMPQNADPMPRSKLSESDYAGGTVEIYGFPADLNRDHWVTVTLRRKGSDGRIQLDPDPDSRTVVKGYSGAPVWDKEESAVVGMIVKIHQDKQRVIAAYMISSELLSRVWQDFPGGREAQPAQNFDKEIEDSPKSLRGSMIITGNGHKETVGKPGEMISGQAEAISNPPLPHADPLPLIRPGGAVSSVSRFYIHRRADDDATMELRQERGMVTIRGPRQTGKTSLLLYIHVHFKRKNEILRSVFVDFQSFTTDLFNDMNLIWKKIADEIVFQLFIEEWQASMWQLDENYDRNMCRLLDRYVFHHSEIPVLLCLDETDRVLGTPGGKDFFGAIRAFFNRGAFDPSWSKIRWLISTSTEPRFFIQDLNMSPFNVGLPVNLGAFTVEEVTLFAKCHGLEVDARFLDKIMKYLGGRPYLVHVLFYEMARRPPEDRYLFLDAGTAGGGIFKDHLERYMRHFQKEEALGRAMRRIISGQGCRDLELLGRLESAGLVVRASDDSVTCACDLYADYFIKRLPT